MSYICSMSKDYNYIKSTFLRLTEWTYPYGYEDDVVSNFSDLFPNDLQKDEHGNYFLKIGESRTVFASHLDTACKEQVKVNQVIEGNIIKTDGKSILGADDKAGVTVMLWMIKNNIPGLYYFFIGEEVGCIGSGLAAKFYKVKGHFDRIISFDRRGTDSIITHQSGTKTCSDEFANELAKQLNIGSLKFKKDDTGVYTDSAEFTSVIPECTNVSVGYYKEHTFSEHQDIKHLYLLANACLSVQWENLPTKRDMSKVETKWDRWNRSYSTGYNSGSNYGSSRTTKTWNNSNYHEYDESYSRSFFDDDEYFNRNSKKTRRGGKKTKNREFYDNGTELIEVKKHGNKILIENTLSKYDPFKDKFIDSSISEYEIEIIKEQYLDMKDPSDRDCYEILKNSYL
jgi:hypothetical protein